MNWSAALPVLPVIVAAATGLCIVAYRHPNAFWLLSVPIHGCLGSVFLGTWSGIKATDLIRENVMPMISHDRISEAKTLFLSMDLWLSVVMQVSGLAWAFILFLSVMPLLGITKEPNKK